MEVDEGPGVGSDRVARPTVGAAGVPVPVDAAAPVGAMRPAMVVVTKSSLDDVHKRAVY